MKKMKFPFEKAISDRSTSTYLVWQLRDCTHQRGLRETSRRWPCTPRWTASSASCSKWATTGARARARAPRGRRPCAWGPALTPGPSWGATSPDPQTLRTKAAASCWTSTFPPRTPSSRPRFASSPNCGTPTSRPPPEPYASTYSRYWTFISRLFISLLTINVFDSGRMGRHDDSADYAAVATGTPVRPRTGRPSGCGRRPPIQIRSRDVFFDGSPVDAPVRRRPPRSPRTAKAHHDRHRNGGRPHACRHSPLVVWLGYSKSDWLPFQLISPAIKRKI